MERHVGEHVQEEAQAVLAGGDLALAALALAVALAAAARRRVALHAREVRQQRAEHARVIHLQINIKCLMRN